MHARPCRAGDITWENRGKLPDRVIAQKAPYTVLATGDLSGREFPVTSHLPMGWQTAGSLRSSQPGEILLAPTIRLTLTAGGRRKYSSRRLSLRC